MDLVENASGCTPLAPNAMTRTVYRTLLVVVLTIAGYPAVASVAEFLGLPNRELSVAMRAFLVGVAVIALLHQLRRTGKTLPHKYFILFFAAFWVLYIARLFIDWAFDTGTLQLPASEYLLFGVGTCCIPAASMLFVRPEVFDAKAIATTLSIVCATTLTITLYNIFLADSGFSAIDFSSLRAETETLNPISIGHVGVSLSTVCLWRFLTGPKSRKTLWMKLLSIAGVLIGLSGILISASRGPMLSAVAMMLFLAIARPTVFLRPLPILGIVVSAALISYAIQSDEYFALSRIAESSFQDEAREELLRSGAKVVAAHPFLGGGIEPLSVYPHNILLESFMVYGFLTGTLFSIVLASASMHAWRLMRAGSSSGWVSLLFVQYSFGAMVSGSLYGASAFWVLSTLVVALGSTVLGSDADSTTRYRAPTFRARPPRLC